MVAIRIIITYALKNTLPDIIEEEIALVTKYSRGIMRVIWY